MTELLYLTDTYQFESTGMITEYGSNELGTYVVLDRTIFYPQWGGQPSDIWTLGNDENIFTVEKVRIDEMGKVFHFGKMTTWKFEIGMKVELMIDSSVRIRNAKNHSAGHLVDVAMKNIGLENLIPTKGYHFIEGPYVEYAGKLTWPVEDILPQLQKEIDILIEAHIPVIVESHPDKANLLWKIPRSVYFQWYEGCGCGGTHVRNSSEIGNMTIRKVKMKDGNLRVSYSIME